MAIKLFLWFLFLTRQLKSGGHLGSHTHHLKNLSNSASENGATVADGATKPVFIILKNNQRVHRYILPVV
jgi:hypothetical protein